MNTPSHFLITAALRKALSKRVDIPKGPFYFGSVAPDIAIYSNWLLAWIYYSVFLGWTNKESYDYIFEYLFFENPYWIITHNFLQSPLIIVGSLLLLLVKPISSMRFQRWWLWFILACFLHMVIDIFTHYDDGPLLLFPFDWKLRFYSPVSYWDVNHYARQFFYFEILLDLFLVLYLIWERALKVIRTIRK